MKVIDSINKASQQLAVRLYTRGGTQADRQRGASALEYIILAVAIIAIVGTLITYFSGQASNPLTDAFSNLFQKGSSNALDQLPSGSGG